MKTFIPLLMCVVLALWAPAPGNTATVPVPTGGVPVPTGGGIPVPTGGGIPVPTGGGGVPVPTGGGIPVPTGGGVPVPTGGGIPVPTGGGFPVPTGGGFPVPTGGGFPAPFITPNPSMYPFMPTVFPYISGSSPAPGPGCPPVHEIADIEPMISFILPLLTKGDIDENILEERIKDEVMNWLFMYPVIGLPRPEQIIDSVTENMLESSVSAVVHEFLNNTHPGLSPEETVERLTGGIMAVVMQLRMRCRPNVLRGLVLAALTNWTGDVTWKYQQIVNVTANPEVVEAAMEVVEKARMEIVKAIHMAFLTPELESLRAEGAALTRVIGSLVAGGPLNHANITAAIRPIQSLSQCITKNIFVEWSLFSIETLRAELIEMCPRRVLVQLLPRVLPPCIAMEVLSGETSPEIKMMVGVLRDFVEEFQALTSYVMDLYEDAIIRDKMTELKTDLIINLDEDQNTLMATVVEEWEDSC